MNFYLQSWFAIGIIASLAVALFAVGLLPAGALAICLFGLGGLGVSLWIVDVHRADVRERAELKKATNP